MDNNVARAQRGSRSWRDRVLADLPRVIGVALVFGAVWLVLDRLGAAIADAPPHVRPVMMLTILTFAWGVLWATALAPLIRSKGLPRPNDLVLFLLGLLGPLSYLVVLLAPPTPYARETLARVWLSERAERALQHTTGVYLPQELWRPHSSVQLPAGTERRRVGGRACFELPTGACLTVSRGGNTVLELVEDALERFTLAVVLAGSRGSPDSERRSRDIAEILGVSPYLVSDLIEEDLERRGWERFHAAKRLVEDSVEWSGEDACRPFATADRIDALTAQVVAYRDARLRAERERESVAGRSGAPSPDPAG